MTITISPCKSKYLPQIIEACERTFEEHRKRQPYAFAENAFDQMLKGAIEASFLEFDENFNATNAPPTDTSGNLFIAQLNDELAGYILLDLRARPQFLAHGTVEISDICVLDGFRGQGVGTALLQFAKDLCDTQKRDNLKATVWAGNAISETMFRSNGFVEMNKGFRYGPQTQSRPHPDIKDSGTQRTLYPAWMFWGAMALWAATTIIPKLAGF